MSVLDDLDNFNIESKYVTKPDIVTAKVTDMEFVKDVFKVGNKGQEVTNGFIVTFLVTHSVYENQEDMSFKHTFKLPKSSDSEKAQKFLAKSFKEFCRDAAGVTKLKGMTPSELRDKCLGQSVKIAIGRKSKFVIDKKNNNKPTIRQYVELVFTKAITETLEYSQDKLEYGLDDYHKEKYEKALQAWNEQNHSAPESDSMLDDPFGDDDDAPW